MSVDSHTLQSSDKRKKYDNLRSITFISKFKEHTELIAALFSGLLVLLTWALSDHLSTTVWVTLHLFAFAIGGYAKAKEGITETIRTKKLNVEMLMIFAAIGSAAIGYWTEGAILIFIFALSGALETYSMNQSSKAISSLMELQPEEALLVKEGQEMITPVSELKIGDHIIVRAGERIPADGTIIKGSTAIDESAITGESMPVNKYNRNEVYAGTVAIDGTITVLITTKPNETLFQKIIKLVQTAQDEKSPSQLFIERFESKYVNIVLIVVAIMLFLPYLAFGWTLSESIYRAMVLLVVASPCALVASITPATLSAISNSAKKGVLFKGGVHLENLSHIKAIALDKTGTLTNGKPVVTAAYFNPNHNVETIIDIVGTIENESTHPLAQAIANYSADKLRKRSNIEVLDMKNISGNGVTAVVDNKRWMIGKSDFVGKESAALFQSGIGATLAEQGNTVVLC